MPKKLKKSDNYEYVFNNILSLCEENGVSATQLVLKMGLSSSAMTAWKNGTIKSSILVKIAEHFGVSLDYLLTGKESDKNLTDSEKELLEIFRQYPEEKQTALIEKIRENNEIQLQNCSGVKVARSTDGSVERQEVTENDIETVQNLPEDSSF